MKLNFKDMTMIYTALTEKADRIASDLKWHEEWAKEHNNGEDDNEIREFRKQLSDFTNIIKRFDSAEM